MAQPVACDYCGAQVRGEPLPEACARCGGPIEAPPAPAPAEAQAVEQTPAYDPWDVWYIADKGSVMGPYPVHMVCSWLRYQQISLTTRIAQAHNRQWVKLDGYGVPEVLTELVQERKQARIKEVSSKLRLPPAIAQWLLSVSSWKTSQAMWVAGAVVLGTGLVFLLVIASLIGSA